MAAVVVGAVVGVVMGVVVVVAAGKNRSTCFGIVLVVASATVAVIAMVERRSHVLGEKRTGDFSRWSQRYLPDQV